ncbi:MAG: diguanylate cyclase [Actinobacteria bacterium]|nr:diguanylate cyclase [Actinomycetota bacterium]
MNILTVVEGHCEECYSCIRACPVKAIKVAAGQIEILDDRCIYCGRCVLGCLRGFIKLEDDLQKAVGFLSSGRKTVVVLAPEYLASFYPMSTEQLMFLIERAGFYGCEDTILGEEMVARQYLRYFATETDFPVIRSTCPAATAWIEKYYPVLNGKLAPIITPMVAQGRLVKGLYGDDIAVVYATPCIAAKYEARSCDSVDAVLTFEEFKHLLRMRFKHLQDEFLIKSTPKPEIRRRYSVTGGFPRPTIAQYNMLDPTLMVIRGVDDLDGLAKAVCNNEIKAKFIDILTCNGCIDGPGIDTNLGIHMRKHVVEKEYKDRLIRASEQLTFDQVESYLPRVETYRTFANRHVSLPMPSRQALQEILAEGEKFDPEDELNCGACGYKTCREHAIAVYQGLAEWSMCFPLQHKVYNRVIRQLKESAVTDGLTGIANHKSFVERLAIEFNRAQRYGSSLSLMMIDVDTFKEINDTYGHVTGDTVLKTIANIIKSNIRQSDFAARYGGDEFALILPETDIEKAYKAGEKLRHKVESTPVILNPDIVVRTTLSIGISSYLTSMRDPLSLVQKADEALYLAKESGRNRIFASADLKIE